MKIFFSIYKGSISLLTKILSDTNIDLEACGTFFWYIKEFELRLVERLEKNGGSQEKLIEINVLKAQTWSNYLKCIQTKKNETGKINIELSETLEVMAFNLKSIFDAAYFHIYADRCFPVLMNICRSSTEILHDEKSIIKIDSCREITEKVREMINYLIIYTGGLANIDLLEQEAAGKTNLQQLHLAEWNILYMERFIFLEQTAVTILGLEGLLCLTNAALLEKNIRWQPDPMEADHTTMLLEALSPDMQLQIEEACSTDNADVFSKMLTIDRKYAGADALSIFNVRAILQKQIATFRKKYDMVFKEYLELAPTEILLFRKPNSKAFLEQVYGNDVFVEYMALQKNCSDIPKAKELVLGAKQVILNQYFRLVSEVTGDYAKNCKFFSQYERYVSVFKKHVKVFFGYKKLAPMWGQLPIENMYVSLGAAAFCGFKEKTLPLLMSAFIDSGEKGTSQALIKVVASGSQRFLDFYLRNQNVPFNEEAEIFSFDTSLQKDEEMQLDSSPEIPISPPKQEVLELATKRLAAEKPSIPPKKFSKSPPKKTEKSHPSLIIPEPAAPAASVAPSDSIEKDSVEKLTDEEMQLDSSPEIPISPPKQEVPELATKRLAAEKPSIPPKKFSKSPPKKTKKSHPSLIMPEPAAPAASVAPIDSVEKDSVEKLTATFAKLTVSEKQVKKTPIDFCSVFQIPKGALHPRVHEWKKIWDKDGLVDQLSYYCHTYPFMVTKLIHHKIGLKTKWGANIRYVCIGEMEVYEKKIPPLFGVFEETFTSKGHLLYHHFLHPRTPEQFLEKAEKQKTLFDLPAEASSTGMTEYEHTVVELLKKGQNLFAPVGESPMQSILYNGRILKIRQKDSIVEIDDQVFGIAYRLFGK